MERPTEWKEMPEQDREIFRILYYAGDKGMHEDQIWECMQACKFSREQLDVWTNPSAKSGDKRLVFELFYYQLLKVVKFLVEDYKMSAYKISLMLCCSLQHTWEARRDITRNYDTSLVFGTWSINDDGDLVRQPDKIIRTRALSCIPLTPQPRRGEGDE